ncbi:MAG: translation initiation factor IF-2 N-terminal domain-containing protein [Nitrospirae bacterium]|nr:translation initiation factor IF-2 N-terminal domain-containing protein [Nitrospirota bacterium]
MSKVRIYELAKQLNRQSKDILDELSRLGVGGKTPASGIDQDIADRIIKALSAPVVHAGPAQTPEGKSPSAAAQKKKEQPRTEKAASHAPREEALKPAADVKIPTGAAHEKKAQVEPEKKAAVTAPGTPATVEVPESAAEPDEAVTDSNAAVSDSLDAAGAPGAEAEEGIEVPDKFKKDAEAEKIEKFPMI